MRKTHRFEPDYVSGCTALCTVLLWLASAFGGWGIKALFPDFDGLPLLLLLWGAFVLACIFNRTAARIFARNNICRLFRHRTGYFTSKEFNFFRCLFSGKFA